MTPDPSRPIESLKLLVVEDNAFTAITVRKTLESLGVQHMQFASNGQEALEFLDSSDQPPDVMLVDLRMPGMGGLALLSRLEDRHYSGYIIVTSGVDAETMNSVQEFALRSNIRVLGFLQKPLKADVLKNLLENRAG